MRCSAPCSTKAGASSAAVFTLHPLVGGMPIEEGWKCLRLFGDEVVPNLS